MPAELVARNAEAEAVFDFCWFPGMDINSPATCCYFTAPRDQPIHCRSLDGPSPLRNIRKLRQGIKLKGADVAEKSHCFLRDHH